MTYSSKSSGSVTDFALLGQMFEDYRPRLMAMVRRRIDPRLSARIDPEEILSEAFFDASRKWNQFRDQVSMSAYAWLYRVVFDRLIETYRKHSRGPRDLHRDMQWPDNSGELLGLNMVNSATSPSQAADRLEIRERMHRALAVLNDDVREVLWMRHFEQLTFAEIGQILGIRENAATLRYVRALKKLKSSWQALGGDGCRS